MKRAHTIPRAAGPRRALARGSVVAPARCCRRHRAALPALAAVLLLAAAGRLPAEVPAAPPTETPATPTEPGRVQLEPATPATAKSIVPAALPQDLVLRDAQRQALGRQMIELEAVTNLLLAHLIRGEAQPALLSARRIHGELAAGEGLAPEIAADLASRLPAPYLDLDRRLRDTAGRIAMALELDQPAVAGEIYGELTQVCLTCHILYARQRFPGLSGATPPSLEPTSPRGETP